MSRETNASEPKRKPTLFSFAMPEAKAVTLAGTFNDWDPAATQLTKDANGIWTISFDLPAGRYEYKFVADGKWCCQPGVDDHDVKCAGCTPNEYGTQNLVLEIA